MLASRTLPPIPFRYPEPPPVATFINIPRRYTRTRMPLANNAPDHEMEGVNTSPRQRKSSRISGNSTAASSDLARNSRDAQAPSSALSSPKVARKRTSSSEDDPNSMGSDHEGSLVDSKPPHGTTSIIPGELSGHICLCQPEPKIPRPRNAFILYRQHHQHAIVSRHPALTNPEISKIIGEQWNAESQDTKTIWQNLAQEEKAKHQEQYPDYRYQPRRSGPRGSSSLEHTTVDKHRCTKCGGRKIISNPSGPFSSTPTPTLPPLASEAPTPTTTYLPPMSNLSLDSPAHRRLRTGSSLSNIQVHSPMHADSPSVYTPGTPDSKRRRYNYSTMSNGRRGDASYYAHHRRDSTPQIPVQHTQFRPSPPNTATMLPPPPPRTPRDARRNSVDLSFLVPENHDQSRSVEAMVMSVPYPIKIKVLGRITPPFKQPGPTSPAIQIRGAVIAIEGDDITAVYQLARWLKDDLAKAQEIQPRIEEPPRVPGGEGQDVSFEDYLDLIKEWHIKSKSMKEFITTPVDSSDTKDERDDKETVNEEKKKRKETEKESDSAVVKGERSQKIPVVILPTYQLHASNIFTSRIPIQDAYSPTDHWQWMATLWRGIVGPDLTIYIQTPDPKEPVQSGKLVDVDYGVRCMTVRREKGADFEPAALRRVGFEVSEWVHDVANKAG